MRPTLSCVKFSRIEEITDDKHPEKKSFESKLHGLPVLFAPCRNLHAFFDDEDSDDDNMTIDEFMSQLIANQAIRAASSASRQQVSVSVRNTSSIQMNATDN